MSHGGTRIILVDDHAVVRAGFKRLLEEQAGFSVVAEAEDGDQAYALTLQHKPDVVVMDLSMPGASGLDTIRRILNRQADCRILVFTMHQDASLAERAIQQGARGYVTKTSAPETLPTAVAEAAAGRLYLSSDITQSLALLKLTGDFNPVSELSSREFEIFRLLISGRPAAEIAATLKLSGKTIANYHTLIKQKLGIDNDVELMLLAMRHRML